MIELKEFLHEAIDSYQLFFQLVGVGDLSSYDQLKQAYMFKWPDIAESAISALESDNEEDHSASINALLSDLDDAILRPIESTVDALLHKCGKDLGREPYGIVKKRNNIKSKFTDSKINSIDAKHQYIKLINDMFIMLNNITDSNYPMIGKE